MFTSIREVQAVQVITSAGTAGTISSTIAVVDPAGSILAARLTGYRALADECRIDSMSVTLSPVYGKSSNGRVAMYIDRDPSSAIVASVERASDQREKVIGLLSETLSLTWRPQEPADRGFELLNPGTTVLGYFRIVADTLSDGGGTAIPVSTLTHTATIRVNFTIRGRP